MIIIDKESCTNCGSCVKACPRGILEKGTPTPYQNNKRECMECMHCTAVCAQKAVRFDGIPFEDTYLTSPEDDLERLIKSRRSIRHFKKTLPDEKIIRKALDTAAWAPNGKNERAVRWSVIYGSEAMEQIIKLLISAAEQNEEARGLAGVLKRGKNLITCDAPAAILSYCMDGALNPFTDAAIATATAELVLYKNGVSTCWGGYLCHTINICPEIREFAGIPEGGRVYSTLLLGYADGEVYPNIPPRPKADISWIR